MRERATCDGGRDSLRTGSVSAVILGRTVTARGLGSVDGGWFVRCHGHRAGSNYDAGSTGGLHTDCSGVRRYGGAAVLLPYTHIEFWFELDVEPNRSSLPDSTTEIMW